MSVLGALDRSMSCNLHPVVQQQLKCLDERMKLVELKIDTAVSAIEGVAVAISRNYMGLNEILDAVSGPSFKSQQNVGQISAQLKDIQDIIQKGFSSNVASNLKNDAESESFCNTTAVVEQAQSGDKEKERFEKEYGYEIEQLSEVPYKKKQSSSSSSSISSAQFSMRNKTSAKMVPTAFAKKSPMLFAKKPLDHSDDESTISENSIKLARKIEKASLTLSPIAQVPASKVTQASSMPSQIAQGPIKPVIDEPIKPVIHETIKPVIQETIKPVIQETIKPAIQETINISDNESVKQISFKDITFCEWISAIKKVKVMGQGKLDFQTGKNHEISVKFTSYDKILNYSMKAGDKWKIVGEQNKGVGFICHEDPEGNGPAKMVMVTFDCPNSAEKLCRFFGENFE